MGGNLNLLITLITINLFLGLFGGLFGVEVGFLNLLINSEGFSSGVLGGILDAVNFILVFPTLIFQGFNSNSHLAVRILLGFIGLLNWVSVAFYIRGTN